MLQHGKLSYVWHESPSYYIGRTYVMHTNMTTLVGTGMLRDMLYTRVTNPECVCKKTNMIHIVSIEYKFQTDIRTGREFNHGIYVDWS